MGFHTIVNACGKTANIHTHLRKLGLLVYAKEKATRNLDELLLHDPWAIQTETKQTDMELVLTQTYCCLPGNTEVIYNIYQWAGNKARVICSLFPVVIPKHNKDDE